MGKRERRPLRESGPSKSNRMEGTENTSSRYSEEDRERMESSEDEEEEEEENLLAPQQNHEIVPMTFEFNDMKESYCYGIAKMLEFLLPNHEARSIGEIIANQGEVGTAIVCEEGDDVFAYSSIVPLSNMTASSPFTQLFEELCQMVTRAGPGEGQSELQSCLLGANREKTGVYLHGRFVNLPVQLIPPLHTNLKEDLQWLISQSTTASSATSQLFAQIQHLLMIVPCSDDPSQQLKKGSCRNVTGSSSLLLSNFEDDIFHNHSTCSLQIQFTKSSSSCCVILLPLDKIGRCIEEIQQLIPP